jgi:hypothetical protein
MESDRIDFISSYCDRWCERCAFTARCSAFALEAAIGMCGDTQDAFELALGNPRAPDGSATSSGETRWQEDLDNDVSDAEVAESSPRETDRDDRPDNTGGILAMAEALWQLSRNWLEVNGNALRSTADAVLRDALETVAHDAYLVCTKLHRALDGRARYLADEDEDDPVQNDWNGSAKVALISLERSQAAWRIIAQATGEGTPSLLAASTMDLQAMVELAFPDAWLFVRPGFDEPGR